MSTRCCVKVITKVGKSKKEVMLYHHHDGYPEWVGYDLVRRSKGWEADWRPYWQIMDVVNSLVKDTKDEYEVTVYNHPDIEYLYTIDCMKRKIKCQECKWVYEDENGKIIDKSIVGREVPIPTSRG